MDEKQKNLSVERLEKISEAPEQGQMMAYTRSNVIFQEYSTLDTVKDVLRDKELLELHLFDNDKEYRCIYSESKRHAKKENGCYLETVVDHDFRNMSKDDSDSDAGLLEDIYEEKIMTEDDSNRMIVVMNHIQYEENGMAYIDNYRLRMESITKEKGV